MKEAIEFNSKLVTHKFLGNNDGIMDAWGRQKIVLDHSLFSSVFTFNIRNDLWKHSTNNISVENNELLLKADSFIQSRRHMRYQPNRGQLFSTACIIPNSNGVARFGLFNEANGCFFEYDNGKLYGVVRTTYNGEILEDRKEIKIDGFDISKGNVFDIQYQWRGVGNYRFLVNLDEVLYFDYLGTLDRMSMSNPSLPVRMETTSSDVDFVFKTSCVDVTTEGGGIPHLTYDNVANPIDKLASNSGTPILALRIKDIFLGQPNTMDYRLIKAILTTDKKTDFEIYYTEDPTALTGASWVDDTSKGFLVDYSATSLDIGKCSKVTSRSYSVGGTYEIEGSVGTIEKILTAGEIIIIYAKAPSGSIRASFDMGVEI